MFKEFMLLCALTVIVGCTVDKPTKSIRIAVASNMEDAMDSLVVVFERDYKISCDLSVSSSGILTSQIKNGAPFDIFLSANMDYPNELYKEGLADKPRVYALGRLALVFDRNFKHESIEQLLLNTETSKIALADPKSAPYGKAAIEFLAANKINVDQKIVYGESISQVNQYITLGTVNAAFTSFSFLTKYGNEFNHFEIDSKFFTPIEQGVSILENGSKYHNDSSNIFIEFLFSEKSKDILEHFGYSVR